VFQEFHASSVEKMDLGIRPTGPNGNNLYVVMASR
jgi:hypothetical protein